METADRSDRPCRARCRDDCGYSMVVVAVSMVAVAALTLLGARAMLGSTDSSNDSVSGNPEVAAAENLQAQQSLSTALGRGLGPRRRWRR